VSAPRLKTPEAWIIIFERPIKFAVPNTETQADFTDEIKRGTIVMIEGFRVDPTTSG
jgi:hypothetical protein